MTEGASTCPACGASTFDPSTGACSRCGYAAGEANRCPHCKAVARIEGTGERAVCAVCGGPRIVANHGGEAARAALVEQRRQLEVARITSAVTLLQATFAVLVTLVALVVPPSTIVGAVAAFVLAAGPLLLALRSRSRAGRARAQAKDASARAWQAAAEDVAARRAGGITARELAKTLGLTIEEADRLLTALAVHDRTRVDVGDDAEVRYSAAPAEPVRVGELADDREEEAMDDAKVLRAKEPVR